VRSDPKGRVAKKRGRLEKRIASRCGGLNLAVAFPGACAQAPDLGACIDRTSYCRLCRSFNAMDALDRDCDIFDDGLENLSCN